MTNKKVNSIEKKSTRTYKASVYVSESDLICHENLEKYYKQLGLEGVLYHVWGFDKNCVHDTVSGSWYTVEKVLHVTRVGDVKDELRYSGYERTDEKWLKRTYPIKCSESAKLVAKNDPTLLREIEKLGGS